MVQTPSRLIARTGDGEEIAFVRLDKVLDLIDNGVKQAIVIECLKENGVFKDNGKVGDVAQFGYGIIRLLSSGIEALKEREKGGDEE